MTCSTPEEPNLYDDSRADIAELYGDRKANSADFRPSGVPLGLPLVEIVKAKDAEAAVQPTLFDGATEPAEGPETATWAQPKRLTSKEKNENEQKSINEARILRWG